MPFRPKLISGILAVVVLFAGTPASASGSTPEQAARAFVSAMANEAISTIAAKDVSREQRIERFRKLLNNRFDVETIGRWVLGRYWRQASPKERSEYLTLFEKLIVFTYAERFSSYNGEKLEVVGATQAEDKDVMVQSRVVSPNGGNDLRVDWRVRWIDGKPKIVDVMVQGVSMGLTQRSDFASVIRQHGGKVEALLAVLRKRLNGGG